MLAPGACRAQPDFDVQSAYLLDHGRIVAPLQTAAADHPRRRLRRGRQRTIETMIGMEWDEMQFRLPYLQLLPGILPLGRSIEKNRIHLGVQQPEKRPLLPRRDPMSDQDMTGPAPMAFQHQRERQADILPI